MRVELSELLVSEEFVERWNMASRVVAENNLTLEECEALRKNPSLIEEYFLIDDDTSIAVAKMGDRTLLQMFVDNSHWRFRREA